MTLFPDLQAPKAAIKPKEITHHGHTRIDNYYWLRDRDNSEVTDYLEKENAYTKKMLAHTDALQETLFAEIKGRIKETDESLPYKMRDYYYYTRFEEGKEYAIRCRKKDHLDNPEEIMLDENLLAEGQSYFNMGAVNISSEQNIVAYATDTVGRRVYDIQFKDLTTGKLLHDEIKGVSGNMAWANDNKTLFYAKDEAQTLRSYQIYRHVLGTDISEDVLVFEEKDETFSCAVYKSKSRDYIMIGSFASLSSEIRFISADKPESEFKVFQPREKDHEYSVSHYNDKFYITTNLEAKNFRLMETGIDKTGKENWTELIAHRENVLLEGVDIFKDFLVVEERKEGLMHIRIMPWRNMMADFYINFGEAVYMAYVGNNPDFDTNILRYGYSSLTTPNSVFDFNMADQSKELKKQQEVLGDFNSDNYQAERIYAKAEDGTDIPMSVVYRKGFKRDGTQPCLIYGYGSYGHTIDPYFSIYRLSLLDRGFVYVIAHVRGGQVNGRDWYEAGKFFNKRNTFTDFIACSEHLINQGYSAKDQLFAQGGSAGGLLMGAIANMRPDLYKGLVAAVPFVDVVTTMLDDSIPLTTGEYDEWGNPNEKAYYEYMLSYSPYDQVKAQDYPNMLVTTGLHDSQVQYWEPAKWVAKLRTVKTDKNVLLLNTNMEAGHHGASGRFRAIRETARDFAFLFTLAGITK